MGVQMACAYVGTTLVPPLFGFLASWIGYGLFQFYLGFILILMFFMVEKLHKSIKNKNKQ
jgi:fucose permease